MKRQHQPPINDGIKSEISSWFINNLGITNKEADEYTHTAMTEFLLHSTTDIEHQFHPNDWPHQPDWTIVQRKNSINRTRLNHKLSLKGGRDRRADRNQRPPFTNKPQIIKDAPTQHRSHCLTSSLKKVLRIKTTTTPTMSHCRHGSQRNKHKFPPRSNLATTSIPSTTEESIGSQKVTRTLIHQAKDSDKLSIQRIDHQPTRRIPSPTSTEEGALARLSMCLNTTNTSFHHARLSPRSSAQKLKVVPVKPQSPIPDVFPGKMPNSASL